MAQWATGRAGLSRPVRRLCRRPEGWGQFSQAPLPNRKLSHSQTRPHKRTGGRPHTSDTLGCCSTFPAVPRSPSAAEGAGLARIRASRAGARGFLRSGTGQQSPSRKHTAVAFCLSTAQGSSRRPHRGLALTQGPAQQSRCLSHRPPGQPSLHPLRPQGEFLPVHQAGSGPGCGLESSHSLPSLLPGHRMT